MYENKTVLHAVIVTIVIVTVIYPKKKDIIFDFFLSESIIGTVIFETAMTLVLFQETLRDVTSLVC